MAGINRWIKMLLRMSIKPSKVFTWANCQIEEVPDGERLRCLCSCLIEFLINQLHIGLSQRPEPLPGDYVSMDNARYRPTQAQVHYYALTVRREHQAANADKKSVYEILNKTSACIHLQKEERSEKGKIRKFAQIFALMRWPALAAGMAAKPFVALLQEKWQREFMLQRQSEQHQLTAFMDATGQTNLYGFAFYALLYKVSAQIAVSASGSVHSGGQLILCLVYRRPKRVTVCPLDLSYPRANPLKPLRQDWVH